MSSSQSIRRACNPTASAERAQSRADCPTPDAAFTYPMMLNAGTSGLDKG